MILDDLVAFWNAVGGIWWAALAVIETLLALAWRFLKWNIGARTYLTVLCLFLVVASFFAWRNERAIAQQHRDVASADLMCSLTESGDGYRFELLNNGEAAARFLVVEHFSGSYSEEEGRIVVGGSGSGWETGTLATRWIEKKEFAPGDQAERLTHESRAFYKGHRLIPVMTFRIRADVGGHKLSQRCDYFLRQTLMSQKEMMREHAGFEELDQALESWWLVMDSPTEGVQEPSSRDQ
jgi:hypothetical protein